MVDARHDVHDIHGSFVLFCPSFAGAIDGDAAKQYVAADLILTAGDAYPERPPQVCLRDVKGSQTAQPCRPSSYQTCCLPPCMALQTHQLPCAAGLGDARAAELLRRLQQDAIESSGSMMLGMLCEAARDQLTAMNAPEGACIFCLDPLCREHSSAAGQHLTKLPCYHCFHTYGSVPSGDAYAHQLVQRQQRPGQRK